MAEALGFYILVLTIIPLSLALFKLLLNRYEMKHGLPQETWSGVNLNICSFCGEKKENLERLIAGDMGCMCSSCLMGAIKLVDTYEREEKKVSTYTLRVFLELLANNSEIFSGEKQSILIQLMMKLLDNDYHSIRILVDFSVAHDQSQLLLACLKLLPQEQWRENDFIHWTLAHIEQGQFDQALKFPVNLIPMLSEEARHHFKMNCLYINIECSDSEDEIEGYLKELKELQDFYSNIYYPLPKNSHFFLKHIYIIMARGFYKQGKLSQAKQYLKKRAEYFKECEYSCLMMGDILYSENDTRYAQLYWQNGLGIAHSSYIKHSLQQRLSQL